MERLNLELSLKSRDNRGFTHNLLTIPGSPLLQILHLLIFAIFIKLCFTYHRPSNAHAFVHQPRVLPRR